MVFAQYWVTTSMSSVRMSVSSRSSVALLLWPYECMSYHRNPVFSVFYIDNVPSLFSDYQVCRLQNKVVRFRLSHGIPRSISVFHFISLDSLNIFSCLLTEAISWLKPVLFLYWHSVHSGSSTVFHFCFLPIYLFRSSAMWVLAPNNMYDFTRFMKGLFDSDDYFCGWALSDGRTNDPKPLSKTNGSRPILARLVGEEQKYL